MTRQWGFCYIIDNLQVTKEGKQQSEALYDTSTT
nr:MAG TPA: hypothetical protein [Caudoviricetes sp.]